MFYQLNTVGVVLCSQAVAHMCLSEPGEKPRCYPRESHTGTHFVFSKSDSGMQHPHMVLPAGEVIKTRLWEGSVQNQCICFAFLAVAMWDATEFKSYIQAMAFRGKRINPVRCWRRKGFRHSVPQRGLVLWFCCTMDGMSFFFRGVNQNIFQLVQQSVSPSPKIHLPKLWLHTDPRLILRWWHIAMWCLSSSDVLHHAELRSTGSAQLAISVICLPSPLQSPLCPSY